MTPASCAVCRDRRHRVGRLGQHDDPDLPGDDARRPVQERDGLAGGQRDHQDLRLGDGLANVVTKQGLAFHKEWLTAAFVDLELPKGMEMAARAKSDKLGISIRIVKGYDIRTNQHLCRLDVLFGLKQTYEDFCCRVAA
jgi:hypothetical protein